MSKKRAINFYGSFNGIYEWGTGYVSTLAQFKWKEYWEKVFPTKNHCHWNIYVKGNNYGGCGSLIGLSNAIYMHPMAIYGVFVERGVSMGCSLPEEDHKYHYSYVFYEELEELRKICTEAAEYCGGSFTLETSKEFEMEAPEANIEMTTMEDYMHKCASVVRVRE